MPLSACVCPVVAAVLLTPCAARADTYFYDFNSGLPGGTAVYGSATVNTNAGVLELNPNIGGQQSAFVITDLAPGRLVRGFSASFRARMVPGTPTPGDGFSFNWAPDLPDGPYITGEEGSGTGLTVVFDTFENGPGEAPAIEVKWNGNVIAHYDCPLSFLVTGNFVDVRIALDVDGALALSYNSQEVFTHLRRSRIHATYDRALRFWLPHRGCLGNSRHR